MRVIFAPLVSDARGRFGGLVASAWRATRVVRRFEAPGNPNTALQQGVRMIFRNATRCYTCMTTRFRAAWEAYQTGKNFTGRNAFIARQVPALQGDVNLNDFVGTPGDASTLQPTIASVTPGAGSLTVAVNAPTPPAGWTITTIVAFAIRDSDWDAALQSVFSYEAEDAAAPYSIVISGLAAVLHQVRAFIVWLAPDGSTRYSACSSSTGTPT